MDRGALDYPLEGRRRHRLGAVYIGDQRRQIVVDELHQRLAQFLDIDGAGAHHLGRFRLVHEREQEMLQRREFMPARIGERQRGVDCLFERVRK